MPSPSPTQSSALEDDGDTASQQLLSDESIILPTEHVRKRPSSHLHSNSDVPDLKRPKSSNGLDSPLMLLPPKIRVKILCCLLCSDEALNIACSGKFMYDVYHHRKRHYDDYDCSNRAIRESRKHFPEQSHSVYPAILRVNRALYNKGKTVLYEKNTLSIRIHDRKEEHGCGSKDCRITVLDHSNATRSREINSGHADRRPSAAPQSFYNFDIHIMAYKGFHRLRLKQTLQELVMNMNQKYPSCKPRKLTLMYEEDPEPAVTCDRCHMQLPSCGLFKA